MGGRGRRMEGGRGRGRQGHGGGLTACECGLTSPPRLQVLSAGLEEGENKAQEC